MLFSRLITRTPCKHNHAKVCMSTVAISWCCLVQYMACINVNDSAIHNDQHNLSISADYFLANVFEQFNTNDSISLKQLESILASLRDSSETVCRPNGKCEDNSSEATHQHNSSSDGYHERHENENACLSAENILDIYGINGDAITPANFSHICPALIQQHMAGGCSPHKHKADLKAHSEQRVPTEAERYGYGTLAVAVISYLPMIILFSIPNTNHKAFPYVMNFLMALATATLLSDGLLHLLPEALGVEDHGDEGHGEEHGDEGHDEADGVKSNAANFSSTTLKQCVLIAAIYGLYILEMLIGTRNRIASGLTGDFVGHGHSHGLDLKVENNNCPLQEISPSTSTTEQGQIISVNSDIHEAAKTSHSYEHSDHHHNHNHQHHHPHEKAQKENLGITNYLKTWYRECIPSKTFGWMIVVGDSIHNFMDGLAIGATFSTSIVQGFSTSLAILFHEIPHEIGDCAALMTAGVTWRGAVTWHVIQTFTAFIGLYIGLGVSTDETARQWVFILTAGIFLHVSLSSLLPELHHINERFWIYFLLQNFGMHVGFWIMFVIAIYEEPLSHVID